MSESDPHPEPAVLLTASSPFEADIVCAVLADAGIPAYREGRHLADEVAIAKQLMGTLGTRIFVPGNRLEEARQALEASRPPADGIGETPEGADGSDGSDGPDSEHPGDGVGR